jgi:hypothetical protein
VSKQLFPVNDLRKALCMGGIFAVSTVLPEKIQHLAQHLGTLQQFPDEVVEHSFQVAGCFLLLSVLIWAGRIEPRAVHPLLAYPPRSRDTVIVHAAGLVVGTIQMLMWARGRSWTLMHPFPGACGRSGALTHQRGN